LSRRSGFPNGDSRLPGAGSMKIVQVSTSDYGGGAESIAMSLMRAYRERGHDSTLVVGRKLTDDPGVRELSEAAPPGRWATLRERLGQTARGIGSRHPRAARAASLLEALATPMACVHRRLGWEYFGFPATCWLPELVPGGPTLVHCHNLHGAFLPGGGYFDLRALPWLSSRYPLFMTLHDAWLFTGHCAHSLDCQRWRIGCGKCPYLDIYPAVRRDATGRNLRRKREIYRGSGFFVATPSRWLMERVKASILQPAISQARVIPNGIDLSVFRPGDRDAARAELGFPPNATVLLSVANSLSTNPWKDYATLRRAVGLASERLANREVVFVILGDKPAETSLGNARVVSFGFTDNSRRITRTYQAADLYLHAARAETFPTTILEALACGVPVVSTAVGGIVEQVRSLALETSSLPKMVPIFGASVATGVLVPERDAEALAAAVTAILAEPELRHTLAANAALDARQRFDLDTQVTAYLDWYHEIVVSWRPASRCEPWWREHPQHPGAVRIRRQEEHG
jgi:glycosyltransferase involved in cell wall biosynthesis